MSTFYYIIKKYKIILLYLIIYNFVFTQNYKKQDVVYILKFAEIAIQEMYKYKIPASITLAQGLLETSGGQSELVKNSNNHFGIKCKNTWKGKVYLYSDDEYMECFRKYDSAEDSYRDHSIFLIIRKNYEFLFRFLITDYKSWAYGLKKAGYATNLDYAKLLIDKIEKYNLYQFDTIKLQKINYKLKEIYSQYISYILK